MNYGRDYGNRNFLERAAHTVRGWIGRGGYDDGYRGMDRGGYDGGYREMGDVNGYRPGGWDGGMEHGYGASTWRGRNDEWNRGPGAGTRGGWGRAGGDEYRTGGYQPGHGAWDVDWDDRTLPQGGMNRGWSGGAMQRGYDRGYAAQPRYGSDYSAGHRGYGDDYRGTGRAGLTGGMMGSDHSARMSRGMQGGTNREWNRGGQGPGMLGGDTDLGDTGGGTIGNYGAYGGYGIERFRSGSAGGVPTGQYWTGYGHGGPYRG
jgi:hypothetical protein